MSDGFTDLIDSANGFFTELALNNRKDWYAPRKAFYTAEIKKPAELLADILAEDLCRATGKPHKPKLFRIHRDVRFSKDKTPYNAHLHLMWSPPSPTAPVWFFGSSPDYLIIGMGVMNLQGDTLIRYRAFIDRDGDDLAAAITASGATISDWGPEPLKRVPKPYGPDHPQANLLKRKALAVNLPLPRDWRDTGLVPSIKATMKTLMPVWALIDGALD